MLILQHFVFNMPLGVLCVCVYLCVSLSELE